MNLVNSRSRANPRKRGDQCGPIVTRQMALWVRLLASAWNVGECHREVGFGVKTGKAQREHMSSAVHPITDIAKILRHVRCVPEPEVGGWPDHLVLSCPNFA